MPKRGLKLPKKRTFKAPASLIRRFVSYGIDFFIINIIVSPLESVLTRAIPANLGIWERAEFLRSDIFATKLTIYITFLVGAITVLYFTYFEYKMQQTPGKMLMKNFIVPEKKKTLTFWSYLISNITFAFFILWVLDLIYMIFSPKNQRFMEKLTKILTMQKYEV